MYKIKNFSVSLFLDNYIHKPISNVMGHNRKLLRCGISKNKNVFYIKYHLTLHFDDTPVVETLNMSLLYTLKSTFKYII